MRTSAIESLSRVAMRLAIGGFLGVTLASCGGGGGSPGTVVGGSSGSGISAGSVSVIFSNSELKSAGIAGTEVTITALVKSPDNNTLAGVPVKFTADSGAIVITDTVSDKNGQAKATIGTSGDRTNRKITVTVQAGGQTASGAVAVVGTSVSVAGPSSIAAGTSGDFTIAVKDSANVPVANVPISYASQTGNTVVVKSSSGGAATAPLTNSQGQVTLTLTASKSGTDTLSISSLGASTASTVAVSGAKFTVSTFDSSGNPATQASTSSSCDKVVAHYENNGVLQTGTANISTSRGKVYSDSTCATLLTASVPITAGDSQPVYVKSDTAGIATITAAVAGGPSAQANLEFIASLTAAATISLQADPAVIGTNSGSTKSEQSTLTAVVRDGTANNNFVKNAVVEFSILSDASGGSLSNPSVATTGSNGSASVAFIAGSAATATGGVLIQAKIQNMSQTATQSLTVSRKSLFISAGTGNTILSPTATQYQQDYSVLVTDASGNAVPGVNVTASVIPTKYRKGFYVWNEAATTWVFGSPGYPNASYSCLNEDVNQNGILDPGEDANGNGRLDPGIPVSVTSSGQTDATGNATISLKYAKDRGNWTEVKLSINGSVSGTEATYQNTFTLPVSGADFSNKTSSPPGNPSPYGTNTCNLAN